MNKLPVILLCVVTLVLGVSLLSKNVFALERTKTFEGVNYVSLSQMSKKYSLNYSEKDGIVTMIGEAVNLIVPVSSNLFELNRNEYIAQEPSIVVDGQVWITAKDWAGLFDLSLTHYDGVSTLTPVDSEPNTTEATVDGNEYKVGPEWGEKVPEAVRLNGSPQKIYAPHIELDIYEQQHSNAPLEAEVQR